MTKDEAKDFETMRGPERPITKADLERALQEASEPRWVCSCSFTMSVPGYVPPFTPIKGL